MAEITNLDSAMLPVLRAQGGLQARASKLPPMIPTFAAKITITGFVDDLPSLQLFEKVGSKITIKTVNAPTELPKGSKLLCISPSILPQSAVQGGMIVSRQHLQQEDVDRFTEKFQKSDQQRSGACQSQTWGIPWSEDEFLRQMVQTGHPSSLQSCLPEVLKQTVKIYAGSTAQQRMAHRATRLGFWLKRMKDLKQEELALKQSMHPDVASVLQGKNVLLWKHMLQACEYSDLGVVDEFSNGTELVGEVEKTGLWPMKFVPASMGEKDLEEVATKERPGLVNFYERLQAADFSEEVWAKTMDEVTAGLLEGPVELSSVPSSYPLSRRFGIQQGAKIRCIDDFSMSSVNTCVQCCESPKPHTLDVFAAMCSQAMAESSSPCSWLGRTFDLTGAYRQCAVNPKSHRHSHIMVQEPKSGRMMAFRMKALPFGAIRSVHSFLRVSHSLWYLMVREFWILTTNYFDDFVTLSEREEAASLKSVVHLFFKMLGWVFAEAGQKAPEFAEEFQALGVLVSVRNMGSGLVTLGNTESRRQELVELLDQVLSVGKMPRLTALKLRGRLQFASANIFGRIARAALSAVTAHAYNSRDQALSEPTILALKMHRYLLHDGQPRHLKVTERECWFLQTDASFENSGGNKVAGVGAVLFNPCGKAVSFFSAALSPEVIQQLDPSGSKKTIMFECEFLALFAAFWKWSNRVEGSLVIYTDNNGVRDAMISCHSTNEVGKQILVATLAVENDLALWPWYSRVPTDSNSADAPSRFSVNKLLEAGAKHDEIDMDECWKFVLALNEKWGEHQAEHKPHVEK